MDASTPNIEDRLPEQADQIIRELIKIVAELNHQFKPRGEEISALRESYASLRERFASLRNDTSSLREKLEQLSNAVRIQEEKIAQRDVRDICKRFRLTLLYMLAPYVTEDVGEFDTTPKLHLREKWTKENPTIFRDKLREHLTTGVMERFLASEFDLDGASLLHLLDTAKNIEDEAENDVLEMFRKLPTQ